MTYKHFISDIAKRTGIKAKVIKDILAAAPETLIQLNEGDQVRTPFGVFRMSRRKGRPLALPNGEEASVDEKLVVRLKPGQRLQGLNLAATSA